VPAELQGSCAVLTGHTGSEDAAELAEWFATGAVTHVDLDACTHLHAAVLQTLLQQRPSLQALPRDRFLAQLLSSLGHASGHL